MQVNFGVTKPLLDFLDRFIELDLRVFLAKIAYTLGVHKYDMLFATDEKPQDKVGMEVACLEKTHTPSLTQVPEQVKFLTSEEAAIVVVEGFQIFNKQSFALVEGRWAYFDNLLL